MRHRDRGGGHVVVAGEDRGGNDLSRQQILGRVQARTVAEIALHDQRFVGAHAGFAQGRFVAVFALQAGGLVGMALDETDMAVAERQEVVRHLVGRGKIVDAHAGGLRVEASGRDRHCRQVRFLEIAEHLGGFAQGRGQDHARGGAVDQPAYGGALRGGAGDLALLQNDLGALATGFVESADQEFAQIGGAGVAVEQADTRACGAGQAARGGIGGVIEIVDRGHHRGARRFAHVLLAVDHARDRHRRDAGALRHVVNRRRDATLSTGLLWSVRQLLCAAHQGGQSTAYRIGDASSTRRLRRAPNLV